MVSYQSAIGPSSGRRAFEGTSCFAQLAYSSATLALSPHCPSRSARAVRPASLAASARYSVCHQSPLKAGAPFSQAWACHAGKTTSFGRAGLAVQASFSEHFKRPPVSQRLKPQSSMSERFCTSSLSSDARRICLSLSTQGRRASVRASSSKQERVGSHQPPNHSFKRTLSGRLRLPPRSA